MIILSLFDGISCGRVALERAGIKVDKYLASEIKSCAIKCSKYNYPDIIHIGDVREIHYIDGVLYTSNGNYNVGKIDLLIGGSPCQDFSRNKYFNKDYEYGLKGNKSNLFFEFLRLKNEIKPTYFLLENVKMKEESEKELNEFLDVKGIHINSSLVSYQYRDRIYWTNIPDVTIPEDKNISFQDYIDTDAAHLEESKMNKTTSRIKMWNNGVKETHFNCYNITKATKIYCLTRKQDRCPNSGLIEYKDFARYLTRTELELAQTLPKDYCSMLTLRQVEDVTGDGWTVDVIAHILSFIKESKNEKENKETFKQL